MSSKVSIVNLALAKIGDSASVSSIDPPEGTPQATYGAMFYPIANRKMQEDFQWTFCTKRIKGVQLVNDDFTEWLYAYNVPAEAIDIISVLPANAQDDYSVADTFSVNGRTTIVNAFSQYEPQKFSLETLNDGTLAILTNVADADIRYTKYVDDPAFYPAGYIDALSYLLAHYLAGPIIKGDVGIKVSQSMLQMYQMAVGSARSADANNTRRVIRQSVPWMAGRA